MSVGAGAASHAGPASQRPAGVVRAAGSPVPPSTAWQLALAAAGALTVAAAVLTWAQVLDRFRAPEPIATHGAPEAVVWSGRVFRSEAELATWLRTRGVVYERWVRSHPAAVSLLRGRERPAAAARNAP